MIEKIKVQSAFLKFSFFLWFLGYQTKKIGIVKYIVALSYLTLKKSNYNLCEIEKLREGKDIKTVKNDYECEDEREKNKERMKNYIYIKEYLR